MDINAHLQRWSEGLVLLFNWIPFYLYSTFYNKNCLGASCPFKASMFFFLTEKTWKDCGKTGRTCRVYRKGTVCLYPVYIFDSKSQSFCSILQRISCKVHNDCIKILVFKCLADYLAPSWNKELSFVGLLYITHIFLDHKIFPSVSSFHFKGLNLYCLRCASVNNI